MGLISRLFAPKDTIVQVAFRELHRDAADANPDYLYSYRWTLRQPPKSGDRVVVPSEVQHSSYAIVCIVGAPSKRKLAEIGPLKAVTRLVPQAEVDAALAKLEADKQAWLDLGCRAVGLPSKTRRRRVPEGHEIPPVQGRADAQTASRYGSAWWRLYKNARTPEEAKAFREVGRYWFAIRDQGGNL